MRHILLFFFFFQAEDGIRDKLVTGVQTCALPISDIQADTATSSHQDPDQERKHENVDHRTAPVLVLADDIHATLQNEQLHQPEKQEAGPAQVGEAEKVGPGQWCQSWKYP